MTQKLATEAFSFTPDTMVELFVLDATVVDAEIHYFTPSGTVGANKIMFDGVEYSPVPIESEGWEVSASGALPEPKLRVNNVNSLLMGLLITYDHLVGCEITRIRTHRKFLDDGSDPDPTVYYPPDVYLIERVSKLDTRRFVEFELRARLDQQDIVLPKRQILRDTCLHSYRVWDADTGSFDYSNVTCPYANELRLFKISGETTSDPSEDVCGRRLSDCERRFLTAPLPTRAFPAVAKTRTRG